MGKWEQTLWSHVGTSGGVRAVRRPGRENVLKSGVGFPSDSLGIPNRQCRESVGGEKKGHGR